MSVDLKYAEKNEGWYYGHGVAALGFKLADAVKGKVKAKDQAEALRDALIAFVDEIGGKGEREVYFRDPQRNREFGYGDCYCVGWEGGPYDWAIVASDALGQVGVFAEPYHGFDLCLWEDQ